MELNVLFVYECAIYHSNRIIVNLLPDIADLLSPFNSIDAFERLFHINICNCSKFNMSGSRNTIQIQLGIYI